MTGPGYTVDEWKQIRAGDLSPLEEGISTLVPFAGLTTNALAHLKRDWISWMDTYVRIDIPATAPCNSFKSDPGTKFGTLPSLTERNEPCNRCRTSGTTDGFENHWQRGVDSSIQSYTAILHRNLAKPAVDFLSKVFQTYNRTELGISTNHITNIVSRLVDSVPDSSGESYMKLMRTGVVLYCHYGLSPSDVANLTPYTEQNIRDIVSMTPLVSFDQLGTTAVMKAIYEEEPVTVKIISEKLDITESATRYRLRKLEDEKRVMRSKTGLGSPATTWETTVHWKTPFRCDRCDFESHSLSGIKTHRRSVHSS